MLIRTPYGRRQIAGLLFGRMLAERGLQVVLQSVRGTFGSGGEFSPFDERADGLATLRWLREQAWHAGPIATMGPSYLGLVQWALAADAGDDLAAMAIQVSASQFHDVTYAGTSLALETAASWMVVIAAQERRLAPLVMARALRRPAARASRRDPAAYDGAGGRLARVRALAAAEVRAAPLAPGPRGDAGRRPVPADGEDGYRYDPAQPTPSLGGPTLFATHPVVDNGPLEARPDVLVFTGPPLTEALEAIGPVRAELWLTASSDFFDVFVRVCEVDRSGVSRNVTDGLISLAPAARTTAARSTSGCCGAPTARPG